MTIYSRNGQIIGENVNTDKGVFNLYDAHQLKNAGKWGTEPEAFVITSLNETQISLAGGTYRVFLGGGGGGGSSIADARGGLGGVFWFEVNLASGIYYAGVGAGGKYNSSNAANTYRNTNSYVCRGGSGEYGNNAGSGSGGGGSYLKAGNTPSTAHWNDYLGIVGGGGGAASHGFTSNYGGHGFGTGGGAWSAHYANSAKGGNNGFDGNGGTGGNPAQGTSSGLYGGNADIGSRLYGGSAGTGSGHNGGGGGGGAGGAGAGAGGGSPQDAGHGGFISTTTTVTPYLAEAVPRGGGGGGGHSNNCGGTAGGGGVLLFTDYPNSWGIVEGTDIPYWGGSTSSAVITQYAAWGDLATYSATYLGTNLTQTTLAGKCAKGVTTTAGGDGFVVIASLNKTISSVTYI